MDNADFFCDACNDLPGPLTGLRVLDATTRVRWDAPALGAYDEEILQDLGLSAAEIEHLREKGIIAQG